MPTEYRNSVTLALRSPRPAEEMAKEDVAQELEHFDRNGDGQVDAIRGDVDNGRTQDFKRLLDDNHDGWADRHLRSGVPRATMLAEVELADWQPPKAARYRLEYIDEDGDQRYEKARVEAMDEGQWTRDNSSLEPDRETPARLRELCTLLQQGATQDARERLSALFDEVLARRGHAPSDPSEALIDALMAASSLIPTVFDASPPTDQAHRVNQARKLLHRMATALERDGAPPSKR